MLDNLRLLQELNSKRKDILDQSLETLTATHEFLDALYQFKNKSIDDLKRHPDFQEFSALPLEARSELSISLGSSWSNVEELKKWASNRLIGSRILAVDGSQIMPSKRLTFPVALVQSGVYLAHYNAPEGPSDYVLDTIPKLLLLEDFASIDGSTIRTTAISTNRWKLEVETALDIIQNVSSSDLDQFIVFLDGTLIMSFLSILPTAVMRENVHHMLSLLRETELAGVPVIGYIDTSYAKDLSFTLQLYQGLKGRVPSDAAIFSGLLREFGDRSPVYLSRREILREYLSQSADYREKVGFCYLRVNSVRPVRLEFPIWILKEKLKHVIEIIAAQAALGDGYPYALLRAHDAAVLKARDREHFYASLENFLAKEGLRVDETIKERRKQGFV